MFDAMNLKQAISDLFDVGVDDDVLSLIYQANSDIRMAVNTPDGLTNRQNYRMSSYKGILGAVYWPQFR